MQILKNTLYFSDVEYNPDAYTNSFTPLKLVPSEVRMLQDQNQTVTETTFYCTFYITEMPDETDLQQSATK